jgi:hypothetical protein
MRQGEAAGDGGDGTSVLGGVFGIGLRERVDSCGTLRTFVELTPAGCVSFS